MRVDELISIIDKIRGVKVCLLVIGKTDAEFVRAGIAEYEKRLKYYIEIQQKEREGELLLGQLEAADYVILLDEKGNEYTSKAFADFLAQKMLTSMKRLVFIIGGPYGFSEEVYKRASMKISLSKMTFSHQMVRMIFTEQLYRAMTILKGEPYHHE